MIVVIIVLTSLGLGGCGLIVPGVWDDELTPYMERHLSLGGNVSYNNLSVTIKEPDDSDRFLAGLCVTWTDGRKVVTLNKRYWDNVGVYERQALVYHELGHCTRGFDHRTKVISGTTRPASLMYPSVLPQGMYSLDMNRYNHEFINPE